MHNFVESGINRLKIAAKYAAPALLTASTLSCYPETNTDPILKLERDLRPGGVIKVMEGGVYIPRNINRRASPEEERFDNFILYRRNEVVLNPIVMQIGPEYWLVYNDTLGNRVFVEWDFKTQALTQYELASGSIFGSDCRVIRSKTPRCEPFHGPIMNFGTSINPIPF